MTKGYENIKKLVSGANNETLKEMYAELKNSNLTVEEIAVMTAIETELENRGIITLNEETFEYELV